MQKTAKYLHTRNSFYKIYADEWSPFELFQFLKRRVPDRKPEMKMWNNLVQSKIPKVSKLTWQRSITMDSCTFCHKWALKIWISEILSVGILPCMNIPVKSNCTWKPTYTFALLIVGDHQSVNRRLGIWFNPDLWAFVSFLYFMDSSKPDAFSLPKESYISKPKSATGPSTYQNKPSHVGKYVPLNSVCSKIPSTPPRACIMSVR